MANNPSENQKVNIVTGAFGYTGRHITRQLLRRGQHVTTLTNHPQRPTAFDEKIGIAPFDFEHPENMTECMQGARTLYNTYWIRHSQGDMTYDRAVEHTRILIEAAKAAGVERVVHISITHPDPDSRLPYFRGKAQQEQVILESGLSYAIIRPSIIFGVQDTLINNIAWLVRNFPAFTVPGSGEYCLQPIYVEDLARIVIEAGESDEDVIKDAVGPDKFTFNELVRTVADALNQDIRLVHISPAIAMSFSRLVNFLIQDVIFTENEFDSLMADRLCSDEEPLGTTHLGTWLSQQAQMVGTHRDTRQRQYLPSDQPTPKA